MLMVPGGQECRMHRGPEEGLPTHPSFTVQKTAEGFYLSWSQKNIKFVICYLIWEKKILYVQRRK